MTGKYLRLNNSNDSTHVNRRESKSQDYQVLNPGSLQQIITKETSMFPLFKHLLLNKVRAQTLGGDFSPWDWDLPEYVIQSWWSLHE